MAVMRESEAMRLRTLANAAVEGIAICDGDVVREVNESLATLLGTPQHALVGMSFASFVASRDRGPWGALPSGASGPVEIELRAAAGEAVPSEILVRSIEHEGRPHRLLAVRDLRERKSAEARIRFLAHHDPLTELPNRALFATRLDQEIARAGRAGTRLAVLCLDLDRFKEINDVFGHQAGDEMLRVMAEALRELTREGDVVARLGGDEFVVVMTDDPQPADASALAERLIQLADRPVELAGQAVTLGVSIGIALYPEDGAAAGELLRNADTALYRAKNEGRGTFRFFEPAMDEALRERRALQHELRQALGRGELRLVYQPQADVRSGEIIGFEALLRWTHARLGNVPPDRFIPLAEECGAMLPIGEWVIREACREAARWPRPLSVAINLSPVQFQTGDLVATVRAALLETGLDPRLLELEVTETVLIRDRERARAILQGLKALGVRLAMDDFGTGYSSLSYLQSFPFDKIKIDRSFISNIERNRHSMTIVKAVVGLGHGLNLEVVAEGVETAQQLELLRGERCDAVQGFLLGRPDDIGSFVSTLERRAPDAVEPAGSAAAAA
jgi:diguanylate cyclase (GGDEF)-like protein/PAS domain S-box-containing protein